MSAAPDITPKPWTAEEVRDRMGQGHWELVRGELRERMPAGWEHGQCTENLSFALGVHVRSHGLGRLLAAETGILIARNPDTIRAADVAFLAREKVPSRAPEGWVTVAPDLVAEVVSPSERPGEIQEKVEDWLAAGVRLAWVVYPERREVHVHRRGREMRILEEEGILDGEEVVPGFSIPVRELFSG